MDRKGRRMRIRRAKKQDIAGIDRLLRQVLEVHHLGRPDLFLGNTKKYTNEQLEKIIRDDTRPVFVAAGEDEKILGYAFCILQQHIGDNILTDIKTLYIDDLCVDENERGRHIGRRLYDFVVVYAKKAGCYNVTLNVWACNEGAMKFYERCGLKMQKMGMEIIL